MAFTCVMSGLTWTQWNKLEANLNSHSMNKSTWYRLTRLVWDAIEAVKETREAAYCEQLLQAGESIVVCADGAWSHPGYTASQHDWVLMNTADSKAIFSIPLHRSRRMKDVIVHQGNYDDGSSKGMEGYALDIALDKLQRTGLVALISGWVGDQDSSVLKQLRQHAAAQSWQVHLDPGHAKRNLQAALMAPEVFGTKARYKGLAERIPIFIMRIIKRVESECSAVVDMRNKFLEWMDCVVPHYTATCTALCPHHQADSADVEAGSEVNSSGKRYLDPVVDAAQAAELAALVARMKQCARYFIHGYNTCNVERYHRERLQRTPKLLEFWSSWAPRCALNMLIHNDGYALTHKHVLAQLSWSLGIEPGNALVAEIDRQRAWHAQRKASPAYSKRADQLARDKGKRRAAHDQASKSAGHSYEHTPPLFGEGQQQKSRRRTSAQVRSDKDQQLSAQRRLEVLFNEGDNTFHTLGAVDVSMGRKRGRPKAVSGKENSKQGTPSEEAPPAKKRGQAKQLASATPKGKASRLPR
jgi:hypothetical protein